MTWVPPPRSPFHGRVNTPVPGPVTLCLLRPSAAS